MKRTYDIIAVFADDTTELFKVRADNYESAEKYVVAHYKARIAHFTGFSSY
jgi:hypothetical protein